MVSTVPVQMLAVIRTASTLEAAVGTVWRIAWIIVETVEIESSQICPEIAVLVTEHHHCGSAAVILVVCFSDFRVLVGRDSESVLKIHGRAFPVTPTITELVKTTHADIALD